MGEKEKDAMGWESFLVPCRGRAPTTALPTPSPLSPHHTIATPKLTGRRVSSGDGVAVSGEVRGVGVRGRFHP